MIIYNSVITEAVIQTRLHGQAVKTSPFHGGNTGSIPVGVINSQNAAVIITDAFLVVKRFTE